MNVRTALGYAIEILLLALAIGLVFGQVLGQPVLLSYVTSESMAPTLETGDGFVAVPSELAGEVETGDVIVFEARKLHGGGLTTHRVVGETDRGFLTKGDANPFPDQDGAEPPVKRSQVVATALQIDGEVVVVPGVGTAITAVTSAIGFLQRWLVTTLGLRSLRGTRGVAYGILALTAVLYLVEFIRSRQGDTAPRRRDRRREGQGWDARRYAIAFAGLVVIAATVTMLATSGATEFAVISSDSPSPRPDVILAGTAERQEVALSNDGVVPVLAYLEAGSEGITVEASAVYVPPLGEARTNVTISTPSRNGYYRRYLLTRRYLAVLPRSTITALYGLHPWAPILAIDALFGGLLYLLGRATLGSGRIRDRSRNVDRSAGAWLQHVLGKLY